MNVDFLERKSSPPGAGSGIEGRAETIARIERMAKRMRRNLLDMSLAAGASSSHFGGGLSIIEITATLYGAIMKYDCTNPTWSERDRFILSKGHGCLGYYVALAEAGFLTREDLLTFEKNESHLIGHPVMNRAKGIEFSNGSLGMGLSLGIGVALAGTRRRSSYRVFVLMGDGECNEGSVWEAAMAAAHFQLDNLVAILDRNNFQQTGVNERIMSVGDLAAKWSSFGWTTLEVDGHDVGQLHDVLAERTAGKPTAVVARTIKGKGFSFSENNNDWHHKILTKSQHELAIAELERK
jgi:transketolase